MPALDEGEVQRLLQEVGSFFPSVTNLTLCFCFFSRSLLLLYFIFRDWDGLKR